MNSVENSAIKIPYMSMIKGFGFLNEQLSWKNSLINKFKI